MKAFALLRAFRSVDEYLTSAELSRRVGLPVASGYRLIQTLESVGAVVRDRLGRYQAGFVTNSVRREGPPNDVLARASSAVLQQVAERFGATAHMGVFDHGMATYVVKASATSSVAVPTRVTAQQEAYCSAIGKVLLAALTPSELESYLSEGELVALTERTITNHASLRAELSDVRREGYAIDRGEAHSHLGCVAFPVRDPFGCTVAAISLVNRIDRVSDWHGNEVCEAMWRASHAVSRNLAEWGATGWPAATDPVSLPAKSSPSGRRIAAATC